MCYEKIDGRSCLGPRSTTVGPRRPRVCVFRIPAFLEATVDPRQVRDNSGSRKPPEGLLWVPVVSASTLGPGAEVTILDPARKFRTALAPPIRCRGGESY